MNPASIRGNKLNEPARKIPVSFRSHIRHSRARCRAYQYEREHNQVYRAGKLAEAGNLFPCLSLFLDML